VESESKHVGNLDKQLCTAIENIHTLLDSISAVEDIEMQAPTVLKIYVRRLADINRVREFVRGDFSDANIRFIRGDICRKELLVEIDGIVDLGRA
jgi:chorismate lyase/3-hydroxybenzoate synthase